MGLGLLLQRGFGLRRVIRSVDLTGPAPLFPSAWAVLGPPPDVPDSGLAFNTNGRLVLIGRASGAFEGRSGIEPGWAVREAARLRRESRVCSEVLLRGARRLEGDHPQEEIVLLQAIRESAGEIEETWVRQPPAYTVCVRHPK